MYDKVDMVEMVDKIDAVDKVDAIDKVGKTEEKVKGAKLKPHAETCEICCTEYTLSKRKKITCCHCQGVACVVCVKKYLLSTFDDAHCLFCRYPWNREFFG